MPTVIMDKAKPPRARSKTPAGQNQTRQRDIPHCRNFIKGKCNETVVNGRCKNGPHLNQEELDKQRKEKGIN